jgi:hypothetical protein
MFLAWSPFFVLVIPMGLWGFYLKIELRGSNVSLQGFLLPFAGWSY